MLNLIFKFFALIILISFVHSDESPVLAKLYSINEQTRGLDIVLTCNVAKGSKPLRFQWFKNGVELSNTGRSTIENKDIFSFFTLRNIDSNDVGNYSSKPILNKFPASEINLSINSSYILPCSISSGSTSIFFEWYKDDHKKLSSTEYKIVIYDTMSSIVFKRLNSNDDTGTYTCNARNVHGTDSITTKLVIQDAPRISKLFSTELNQSEGSVLNIPCSVISGSTPLSFKWFKNEQELLRHRNPELSYQIKTDNFLSFLTISKLKAADSGNYSCIVGNQFGIDIQWTLLQVQESPLLLKQFAHLSSLKGSDIVFTCNVAKKSTHKVLCDLNDSCNY
ncbi:immunoglobulin domain containing protein [Dermatophagoides farinae]|uniref:Immunoglobulin domain containing protein n=1 Tax=Dermatophagoides farinae TaxID=6954 RepID=A0A9D4NRU1_DERFA|nr:immunoglobulin domain containing protein [Dermatophagoides farinae]